MNMTQIDEPPYQQDPSNYHTSMLNNPSTTQRQQLYPCTANSQSPLDWRHKETNARVDSPVKQPFGMRPPSRQGQGLRSAVVSATTGRMPLERLSNNVPMNTGSVNYRGVNTKSVVTGNARAVGYSRKWGFVEKQLILSLAFLAIFLRWAFFCVSCLIFNRPFILSLRMNTGHSENVRCLFFIETSKFLTLRALKISPDKIVSTLNATK